MLSPEQLSFPFPSQPFLSQPDMKAAKEQQELDLSGMSVKAFPNLLFYLPGKKKKISIRKLSLRAPCEGRELSSLFAVMLVDDMLDCELPRGVIIVVQLTVCLRLLLPGKAKCMHMNFNV